MKKLIVFLMQTAVSLLCAALTVALLTHLVTVDRFEESLAPKVSDAALMEAFEEIVDQAMQDAREGALSVPKHFWIPEDAETIPKRDDSKYGEASDASELGWLLEEAAPLLDGQETVFNTGIQIRKGSKITYYLDESILSISWQQVLDRVVYTFCEVKISDPSQFRRHLSDGYYGSTGLYTTTQLSAQAGAVTAISGDYFRCRPIGIVIYDGEIKRFTGESSLDTCFVDAEGNLLLMPSKSFETKSALKSFIQEHGIDFNVCFGPILIKDGVRCEPKKYGLGEINDGYPRCAICQKDELHYILVTVNGNGSNVKYPTVAQMTDQIEQLDVQQAYCLDGGRTGVIAMQDRMMNPQEYKDGQRRICDIMFFATAIPSE